MPDGLLHPGDPTCLFRTETRSDEREIFVSLSKNFSPSQVCLKGKISLSQLLATSLSLPRQKYLSPSQKTSLSPLIFFLFSKA
jgi:hypothetical protein